jgi:plasmid stabilization system protein ParE
MTYRFLSLAQQDVAEAMRYYEEAVPGLGLEFLEELERTVQRILHQPEAWTRLSEHQRRCRMRRFPYGVVYSIEDDGLVILAVFHLHRHPDSWKERT